MSNAALDGTAWGVADAAMLIATIDVELAEREATDRELLTKGRIDPLEADWRKAVIADIREDLLFAFAPLDAGDIRSTWDRSDRRVTWHDKVRWIERELADRRAGYPELVAKGRIEEGEARRRVRALGELRRLYWCQMFQWEPSDPAARDYLAAVRKTVDRRGGEGKLEELRQSDGYRAYREHVRAHMRVLDQEAAAVRAAA
jgi:hypothetical protein